MSDEDWIIIDTDEDKGRLRKDGEKLRKIYPERYDIRITPLDLDPGYALSVRHRD
jgi:hypothetical protein